MRPTQTARTTKHSPNWLIPAQQPSKPEDVSKDERGTTKGTHVKTGDPNPSLSAVANQPHYPLQGATPPNQWAPCRLPLSMGQRSKRQPRPPQRNGPQQLRLRGPRRWRYDLPNLNRPDLQQRRLPAHPPSNIPLPMPTCRPPRLHDGRLLHSHRSTVAPPLSRCPRYPLHGLHRRLRVMHTEGNAIIY